MMVFYIIGCAFCAVGVIISIFLTRKLLKAFETKRWRRVEGKIEQAATRNVVSQAGEINRAQGWKATVVDYVYTYEVDGTSYKGTRVTLSDQMVKTAGSLSALAKKYKEGQSVIVYYNPANPSDAALKPGPSVYNFTPFITAVGLIAVGIAIIIYGPTL